MRIFEVKDRGEGTILSLLHIWESSVRATHLFLSEQEIARIKKYVPQAVGFYGNMGIRTYRGSETEEKGGPDPILYMEKKKARTSK